MMSQFTLLFSLGVAVFLLSADAFSNSITSRARHVYSNSLVQVGQTRFATTKLFGVERKYEKLIDYFNKDDSKVRKPTPKLDVSTQEDFKTIEAIVKIADWRKANDITVLYLGDGIAEFTNFMVIIQREDS